MSYEDAETTRLEMNGLSETSMIAQQLEVI